MTPSRTHRFFTVATLLATLLVPTVSHAAVADGSLIKGQTSSAVYYVTQGKRYAFPNERVFRSWYWDFSSVQTVPDTDLASYQLGGNVRYRPGMNLVKITTDPKVYAVSRYGVLRWVTTEQLASLLYGNDWSTKVHDVPDTFFTNYVIGSALSAVNDYDGFGEQAASPTIAADLRPLGYVPPIVTTPVPVTPLNPAEVDILISTSQATLNQMVHVVASATKSNRPITAINIWSDKQTGPVATCTNVTACSFTYTVNTAPLLIRFRATATDDNDKVFSTPPELDAVLNVPAVSTDIVMDATPYTVTSGARFAFTSDARKFTNITRHRVFVVIPGQPTQTLWKDCGVSNFCTGSTPLYRTSQFLSEVETGGQTFRSASITVSVTGNGIPHPTLTLVSKPTPNQATMRLDAPSGDTIGWSTIVEGTTPDSTAIALCEFAQCSITVQFSKPVSFTGYTDVGGKLEASNSLYLEP